MHDCPREGCTRRVPDKNLACSWHWCAVTPATRRRVRKAYAGGAGVGSDEHTEAIVQAITEMNAARP